tara:strand:- start:15351 stop:16190 length:840 start_codon:yes stop_codon:yes gene_type:complete
MISIFIMYSSDRKTYLEKQIEHMRNMPLYDKCQKILVLDGELNVDFEELEVVPLNRDGEFVWADAWMAGVNHSKHEKILYLDSDRLLPLSYLERIEPLIQDNRFIYTSNLFTLCLWPGKGVVDTLLSMTPAEARKELSDLRKGMIIDDPRFKIPVPRHGKNPMSGNTAFTKTTFIDSGGVDPWYKGHGAFADSDYFMQMYDLNADFYDVEDIVELHFGHTKKNEEGKSLSDRELGLLSLDNFIHYCKKWGISRQRAIDVAKSWRIQEPDKYVYRRWSSI